MVSFSWIGPEWGSSLKYRDDSLVTDVRPHSPWAWAGASLPGCGRRPGKRLPAADRGGGPGRAGHAMSGCSSCTTSICTGTISATPRSSTRARIPSSSTSCAATSWRPAARARVRGRTSIPATERMPPRAVERPRTAAGSGARFPGAPRNPSSAHGSASNPAAARRPTIGSPPGRATKRWQPLNRLVHEQTPDTLIERTTSYWRTWARKEVRSFGDLSAEVANIYNRSLLILRSQIDNGGAIIAANDSDIVRFGGDTYSYMWGRDGAFVAAALARAGYSEVCRPFFDFCSKVASERGYLLQHYNPDGSVASNWHAWLANGEEVLPIQEDSTALLLWALWIHYESSRDLEFIRPLYETFVLKCADFLLAHRDLETLLPHPSYDLWEERFGVHTFTVAAVVAGLRAAARFAGVFQDGVRAEAYETAADKMAAAASEWLFDDVASAIRAVRLPDLGRVPAGRCHRCEPARPGDARDIRARRCPRGRDRRRRAGRTPGAHRGRRTGPVQRRQLPAQRRRPTASAGQSVVHFDSLAGRLLASERRRPWRSCARQSPTWSGASRTRWLPVCLPNRSTHTRARRSRYPRSHGATRRSCGRCWRTSKSTQRSNPDRVAGCAREAQGLRRLMLSGDEAKPATTQPPARWRVPSREWATSSKGDHHREPASNSCEELRRTG